MIKTLTKKIIVFTMMSMLVNLAAFSQYTLQSNNVPAVNDTWTFKIITDTTAQPGPSGAGVIWDFSLLTVTVNTKIQVYKTPSATGVDATFPTANMKSDSYFGWTDYFYRAPGGTELQYLGFQNSSNEVHISNTQKILTIPLTYGGSVVNAALAGTGYSGSTLAGTISAQADGYGTLKVGGLTFTNVTRVKTDFDIIEDLGGGAISTVHVLKYSWYKSGNTAPYMEVSTLHQDGFIGPSVQKYITVYYRVNVGIDDLSKPTIGFSVYPNPVKSEATINLSIDRTSDVTLQLMDITGKVKITQTSKMSAGEHEVKMDVSDLPKGVYVLSAISGTVNRQQRMIIAD